MKDDFHLSKSQTILESVISKASRIDSGKEGLKNKGSFEEEEKKGTQGSDCEKYLGNRQDNTLAKDMRASQIQ